MNRLLACLLLSAPLAAAPAHAQDFPSKPIRVIVPIAAGGVADIVTRVFAAKLGEDGKTTVVVENRGGAAGVPATEAVAKSPADGYTLLTGHHGVLSILPHLQKLPYDPAKEFVPVVNMIMVPNILTVHPSVPAKNVQGADRLRQGQPGKADLCLAGRRHHRPHRRRTVQARGRHRHHPRALQGRGAGATGSGRRAMST